MIERGCKMQAMSGKTPWHAVTGTGTGIDIAICIAAKRASSGQHRTTFTVLLCLYNHDSDWQASCS